MNGANRNRGFLLLLLIVIATSQTEANADIITNVSFDDASGRFSGYFAELTRQAQAAGRAWGRYLNVHPNASLELEIAFDPNIATASGGARSTSFVATRNGFRIFEMGTAAELRNGVDVNGSNIDLRFTFSHDYILNRFWYDPDPDARTAPVPADMLDAQSTFIHEYGHALAFSGWSDRFDGSLPGNYQSPFDELIRFDAGTSNRTDDDNLFFIGASAMQVYGGEVPLTYGNSRHYGNSAPRPGQDLIDRNSLGLMNGVRNYAGVRRSIADLDIAILRDTGMAMAAVAIPEPSSVPLLSVLCVLATRSRRRSKRST